MESILLYLFNHSETENFVTVIWDNDMFNNYQDTFFEEV